MPKAVYAQVTVATAVAVIKAGDPWDPDDPLVLAHPDLFGPEPPEESIRHTVERTARPVEQATRNPGERRRAPR